MTNENCMNDNLNKGIQLIDCSCQNYYTDTKYNQNKNYQNNSLTESSHNCNNLEPIINFTSFTNENHYSTDGNMIENTILKSDCLIQDINADISINQPNHDDLLSYLSHKLNNLNDQTITYQEISYDNLFSAPDNGIPLYLFDPDYLETTNGIELNNSMIMPTSSTINRINIALGRGADERGIGDIRNIIIHHSGSPTNGNHLNTAFFENDWRNNPGMGAPNARGGYHEVVLFNGNVEVNMQDRRRTWGAGDGSRFDMWHICCTGQHALGINNISQTQLNVLAQRIAAAFRRFGWNPGHVNRIIRHKEVIGQSTACNDINVVNIRNAVSVILGGQPATPENPPSSNIQIGSIVRINPTALTWATGELIAQSIKDRDFRVIEMRNNNSELLLEGVMSWIRRTDVHLAGTSQPPVPPPVNPPSITNIQVGSRVRVNQNAQTWATGEVIASWVRGQEYTVLEVRQNGTQLLLSDVISLIRTSDVTLVSGGGNSGGNGGTHIVQAGDTLFRIAQMYNTTVSIIQQLNGMGSSTILQIGQVLILPNNNNFIPPTTPPQLPNPPMTDTLIGAIVQVRSGTVTWATGQPMPSWVWSQVYTVIAMSANNTLALLNGVISWVRVQDLLITTPPLPSGSNITISQNDRILIGDLARDIVTTISRELGIPGSKANLIVPSITFGRYTHTEMIGPTCSTPMMKKKITVQTNLSGSPFQSVVMQDGFLMVEELNTIDATLDFFRMLNFHFPYTNIPDFRRNLPDLFGMNLTISLVGDGFLPAIELKASQSVTLTSGQKINFEVKVTLTVIAPKIPCDSGDDNDGYEEARINAFNLALAIIVGSVGAFIAINIAIKVLAAIMAVTKFNLINYGVGILIDAANNVLRREGLRLIPN